MRKYLSKVFVSILIIAALMPMRARAAGNDGLRLDEKGTVTVVSQHAAKEGISSLGFSLLVESADAVRVEFLFEESKAKVQDFRYDENANRLNIYLAGTEALFAEGTDALTIGKVIVLDAVGKEASAQVSVVEDSLQYVYGTETKTMQEIDIPDVVHIGPSTQPSQSTQAPPQTAEPTQAPPQTAEPTQAPSQTAGPTQTAEPTQAPPQTVEPTQAPSQTGRPTVVQTPKPGTAQTATPSPDPVPVTTITPEATGTPAPVEIGENGGSSGEGSLTGESHQQENETTSEGNVAKGVDVFIVIVVIAVIVVVVIAVMALIILKKKPNSRYNRRNKDR